MAIFAISDLHLSLNTNKSMDVFGDKWNNYMDKIKENWSNLVKEEDYVIISGDISWSMYLEETYKDFDYINKLKGIKIISKGNHDYWWTTLNKLNNYLNESNFKSIFFLHNNAFICNNKVAICGTKGCDYLNLDKPNSQDKKIYDRELQRLELSIKEAIRLNAERIIVSLHYPPACKNNFTESGFIDIIKKYAIKTCVYGHIHDKVQQKEALIGNYDGIDFYLVSSDYLKFMPLKIMD